MHFTQRELKNTASRTEAGPNMELIKYPNPILATVSKDVELTPEVLEFIEELEKFYKTELKWGVPVGLAAPQVGKNWNIFVALGDVYINPVIVKSSRGGNLKKEGCYSLPKSTWYDVRRNDSLTLSWTNKNGDVRRKYFFGFEARVIQHEFDHLQGKLCNKK